MTRETEARLVEDHLDFLQGECRTMVRDEKREGQYDKLLVSNTLSGNAMDLF